MSDGPNITRIASAIGEPARAEMLTSLLDRGWAKRERDSRLVKFRANGERALQQVLGGAG